MLDGSAPLATSASISAFDALRRWYGDGLTPAWPRTRRRRLIEIGPVSAAIFPPRRATASRPACCSTARKTLPSTSVWFRIRPSSASSCFDSSLPAASASSICLREAASPPRFSTARSVATTSSSARPTRDRATQHGAAGEGDEDGKCGDRALPCRQLVAPLRVAGDSLGDIHEVTDDRDHANAHIEGELEGV